jgi:hypothetical protein
VVRSAKVEKFEDLIAWQKAHLLATNLSEQEFSNTYSLCRDVGNLIGGLRKSLGNGGAS